MSRIGVSVPRTRERVGVSALMTRDAMAGQDF